MGRTVEFASRGYTGLFDLHAVDVEVLDQLYAFDLGLFEALSVVRARVEAVRAARADRARRVSDRTWARPWTTSSSSGTSGSASSTRTEGGHAMAPIMMEVIEWFDQSGTGIVHRYPEGRLGRHQDGRAAHRAREPGRGVLPRRPGARRLRARAATPSPPRTCPILTRLLSLPWGFTSPFRAEVYFVNLKVFTNMRWGTRDPVAFKDTQLGLIRLRAFGNFTMRVTQPLLFVTAWWAPRAPTPPTRSRTTCATSSWRASTTSWARTCRA